MERINAAKFVAMDLVKRGWTAHVVDDEGGPPLAKAASTDEINSLWRVVDDLDMSVVVLSLPDEGIDEPMMVVNGNDPEETAANFQDRGAVATVVDRLENSGALDPDHHSPMAARTRAEYELLQATADWTELGSPGPNSDNEDGKRAYTVMMDKLGLVETLGERMKGMAAADRPGDMTPDDSDDQPVGKTAPTM